MAGLHFWLGDNGVDVGWKGQAPISICREEQGKLSLALDLYMYQWKAQEFDKVLFKPARLNGDASCQPPQHLYLTRHVTTTSAISKHTFHLVDSIPVQRIHVLCFSEPAEHSRLIPMSKLIGRLLVGLACLALFHGQSFVHLS